MSTHELVVSMDAYIEAISEERNLSLGQFIKSMRLPPPSPEEFLVTVEKYAPGYDDQEYESDDDHDNNDAKKEKKKRRR